MIRENLARGTGASRCLDPTDLILGALMIALPAASTTAQQGGIELLVGETLFVGGTRLSSPATLAASAGREAPLRPAAAATPPPPPPPPPSPPPPSNPLQSSPAEPSHPTGPSWPESQCLSRRACSAAVAGACAQKRAAKHAKAARSARSACHVSQCLA